MNEGRSCKYCREGVPFHKDPGTIMSVNTKTNLLTIKQITEDYTSESSYRINNCPMCGGSLTE